MATFTDKNFNSTAYQTYRPEYPDTLFQLFENYLSASSVSSHTLNLAVDLATGTGQVARALRDGKGGLAFQRVIAIDPSETMIGIAKQEEIKADGEGRKGGDIQYVVASAENTKLPDASVDFLTVGQAAHWFDMENFWKEANRILRPGGIVVIFGYGLHYLPGNTEASQLIISLSHEKLGKYWEQPGKEMCEKLYASIIPPENFTRFERHVQTGESDASTSSKAPLMRAEMPLSHMEAYMKTWSAWHRYKEQNPSANEPDLVTECIQMIRACIEVEHTQVDKVAQLMLKEPEENFDPVVEVVWPFVVLLAEKK